jgi:hypothetical protein
MLCFRSADFGELSRVELTAEASASSCSLVLFEQVAVFFYRNSRAPQRAK